jgi:pimeloyl-ACP methyl ester carboxylesterase
MHHRFFSLSFLLVSVLSCASTRPAGYVDGPAGRIRVDDGGRGAALPVLFVHGNGGSHEQWSAQLAHLRSSRRAIAVDLRGMGASDAPADGDYSVPAMVADLEAVARSLRLERFVIAGHSYGGAVVAAYAAAHPERVAGIVFVDSAGNVTIPDAVATQLENALKTDKSRFVRQWFAAMLAPSGEAVRNTVLASADRTPAAALSGALLGLRSFDMRAALDAYKGPCVAIAATTIEQPASFHRQFTRCPVEPVAGTGHWVMLDKPEEVNRILDVFLASLQ